MSEDKESGIGRTLGAILSWAAALCMAVWALDRLLARKWGLFVILVVLWTIGSALILALALGMIFDMAGHSGLIANDAVVGGEWIASAILGVIIAAGFLAIEDGRLRKLRRSSKKGQLD